MRKLFALVVALCLALTLTASAEVAKVQYNFGDFNMTMNEDIYVESYEKLDKQLLFVLYQPMDADAVGQNNMNCTWSSEYVDVSGWDVQAYADSLASTTSTGYAAMGINVSDVEIIDADFATQDGKLGTSVIYSAYMDYTALGEDMALTVYFLQSVVSDPLFGSYTFTISTEDIESAMPLIEAVDSITWNR